MTDREFLSQQFEQLLAEHMPLRQDPVMREVHWLNENHCWTPAQVQIVRDWIRDSGGLFKRSYERLEAADLVGSPFTGKYSHRNADFAQEVLCELVTLRDRKAAGLAT